MDFSSNKSYIIVGVTSDGKKFRPSDWAERLACVFSTYAIDKRLKYSPHVSPCFHEDWKAVFVNGALLDVEPKFFKFIFNFAKDNDLKIIESC